MTKSDNFSELYLNWLKENIEQAKINNNTFRLTLPFLNKDNDFTEIYIIRNADDSFLITDDGATLNDLKLSGFDPFSSNRRKDILDSILIAHGVTKLTNNELIIECTLNDLALKKHMLAQCMVKVSDMFYLSKNNVQSLFFDDVQHFFDVNKIRYVDNVAITGKSKLPTHYDFIIGHSDKAPERLIKVVNNLDSTAAKTIIFAWNDTKEVRRHGSELYTFIQDINKKISPNVLTALKEYDIHPALWSNRMDYLKDLSA